MRILGLSAVGLVLLVAPAAANDVKSCGSGPTDQRIAACSRLIATGKMSKKGLSASFNNRGWGLIEKKEFDRAIADLDKAIELDPSNGWAYNNRGWAYNEKHQTDRALADLDRAIKLNPSLAFAYSNRAVSHLAKSNLDQALADIERGLKLAPRNANALHIRGLIRESRRQFEPALADFRKALEVNGSHPFAANSIRRVEGAMAAARAAPLVPAAPAATDDVRCTDFALSQGQRIEACGRAIASGRHPAATMATLHYHRGTAYQTQDVARAVEDFNAVLRYDPQHTLAKNRLATLKPSSAAPAPSADQATCTNNNSVPDERIAACNRVLGGTLPDKERGIYVGNRGRGHLAKQDNDRAIADFSESLRLNPDVALIYNERGVAYARKRDFDRAMSDYDNAARLGPTVARFATNRGGVRNAKGDYDQAIAILDEAVRLHPQFADAYLYRGNAYRLKGDYERALPDYDAAIRLDASNETGWLNRGFVHVRLGRHDQAINDYSELIRRNPRSAVSHAGRGAALRLKGEPDRAMADLEEAIRLDPKHARAYFHRAMVLESKGDPSRAVADLRRSLELNGKDTEVQAALARLERGGAPPTAPVALLPARPDSEPVAGNEPSSAARPSAAPLGPRVALVIGNGAYRHSTRLPNPANDATDLAAALRRLGFDVVEGRDLDKRAMEDKIREFGRKLDRADLALFFYAGHGMQVGSKNYLMPIDAKLERATDLSFETIDVGLVLGQMESEQRVNLVFLDACRDNPLSRSLARSLGTRSSSVGQGLATIQSAIGTMIAYATQPDNVALDGEGRNSPFTKALLKHLVTPGLEIGTVMRRVRQDVVEATRRKQVPWDHSSLIGDVILVR